MEDAKKLIKKLVGVDDVLSTNEMRENFPPNLKSDITIYTMFTPAEGQGQSRYELEVANASIAADPWDGRTLEWSIPSPPPVYNFRDIPIVKSLDDFWHTKQNSSDSDKKIKSKTKVSDIHLPQPSYWPFLVSVGLAIAGFGIIYNLVLTGIGIFIMLITVCAWSFEPVNEPDSH